ncbi:MAG: site-specific integrase [Pirellulales bacterium]
MSILPSVRARSNAGQDRGRQAKRRRVALKHIEPLVGSLKIDPVIAAPSKGLEIQATSKRRAGISSDVRRGIVRATMLLANGKTFREAALILEKECRTIAAWQNRYPELWQAYYQAALQEVRETVRQLAGRTEMFADLDAYVLAARHVQQLAEQTGEPLFDHGDALTLTGFYRDHYKGLRTATLRTAQWDESVLRRWAILTGDPPLEQIATETLCRFRDALLKLRGMSAVKRMSPNTVRTVLNRIQTFLDKAGPAGWRNRDAVGLIDKVPWVKLPPKVRRTPKTVSDETLNEFYLGCVAAEWPRSDYFKPPAWWRALIVTAYNTGMRRNTLFSLRMKWIDWQARCIVVPAEVTKTQTEQVIPLNQAAVDHLRAIRTDREFVFEYPTKTRRDRRDVRGFHVYFHRLQDACAIPAEQHFTLHQLRKTCATNLWEYNPQAAQYAMGHTSLGTTAAHYVRGHGMLARAVEQMPQPSAFAGKAGAA